MRVIAPILLASTLIFAAVTPARGQSALDTLERTLRGEPRAAITIEEPGYLGLTAVNVIGLTPGVRVLTVLNRSAAAEAGLRPGDIIRSIDGDTIRSMVSLGRRLSTTKAGTRLNFTISRDGARLELPVTLGVRSEQGTETNSEAAPAEAFPRDATLSPTPQRTALAPTSGRATLGVRVVSPGDRNRPVLGLAVTRGAVIYSITPGSPADRYGLPLGGVIVAIDGRRTYTPTDLVRELTKFRVGQTVELTYYVGIRQYRKRVTLAPSSMAPAAGDNPLVLRPDSNVPTGSAALEALERQLGGPDAPPLANNPGPSLKPPQTTQIPLPLPVASPAVKPPAATPPIVEKTDAKSLRKEVVALKARVAELENMIEKLVNAKKKTTSVSPADPNPTSP